MSEMVERVARVICLDRGGRDPDDIAGGPHPGGTWLDNGEPWWRGDVDAARAAIEAMREPTEAMLKRFNDERPWGHDPGDNYIGTEHMRSLWSEMIDTALKEPDQTK